LVDAVDETFPELEPRDPLAEGYEELKAGDYWAALKFFHARLKEGPKDSRVHSGLGIAYMKLKDWDKAVESFSEARKLDPEDVECWLGLGVSMASAGRIYAALSVLEALLEHRPRFVRGFIQAGLLYFKLAVPGKGREYMQKALDLEPSLEEHHIIEAAMEREKQLDKKRAYRPDFEALRKQKEAKLKEAKG
jgi:tetratricopeptide (TPR) repeat protein